MFAEVILLLLGAGMVIQVLVQHVHLRRGLEGRLRPSRLITYPSVSVIRPIKGLDAGAVDNIAAALDHGYPGPVETIFVMDDRQDPSYPLVMDAIARHHDQNLADPVAALLCGPPAPGLTGKLNAMIAGLAHCQNEVIVFADSDIRPDKDGLRVLVETLMSSRRAGSAFTPVYSAEPTHSPGDAGYALLLNGLYGSAAAAAARRRGGEMPFIMGQFMAFRRQAIKAIGGLESARGQLVDDMYLGARVEAAGFKNLVSPHATPIIQYGLGVGEFLATYRRWITFSRSGLPDWRFKFTAGQHGVTFWLGLILAAGGVYLGWLPQAALGLLAAVSVVCSINRLHSALGGAPLPTRHAWAAAGLLLSAPFIFLTIYMKRDVTWRGRSYSLDGGSRLEEGDALEADEAVRADLAPARR